MVNKFDTQFLIEGSNLDEDDIRAGIMASAEGDCLIVVGDEEVVKVHYHTDTPWKVLEYAASQGDLHKIIVENMERQGKRAGWVKYIRIFMFGERHAVSYKSAKPFAGI